VEGNGLGDQGTRHRGHRQVSAVHQGVDVPRGDLRPQARAQCQHRVSRGVHRLRPGPRVNHAGPSSSPTSLTASGSAIASAWRTHRWTEPLRCSFG
jgi:hypothetical protein